jgi:hypothetical protein
MRGFAVGIVGIIEWLRCHEAVVSECWIAQGSNLAREALYHRNFQGADPRADNDAQVEPGWRSTG